MIKKVLFFLVLLLQCSISYGALFTVENETILVDFIAETHCYEEQRNIFRLERQNYTTNISSLNISYTYTCTNFTETVAKTINKFTSAQTGKCTFSQTKNNSVLFTLNNQSHIFYHETICTTQEIEPLPLTNTTNTSTIKFNSASYETNISATNTIEKITCFKDPILTINKAIFEAGEQLLINFSAKEIPDEFIVTYGIETITGEIIKSYRNTSNLNTKKHTFSSSTSNTIAFVRAYFHDACGIESKEELIIISHENIEEEQEEIQETKLELESITIEDLYLEVSLLLQRGSSRSSVVTLDLIHENGKILMSEKIKVTESDSALELTSIFPLPHFDGEVSIHLHGLGLEDRKTILLPKKPFSGELISTHTKQQTYTSEIDWYVRTKVSQPSVIEVQSANSSTYLRITDTKESTHKLRIPYTGGSIITILHQGDISVQQKDTPTIQQEQSLEAILLVEEANISVNGTETTSNFITGMHVFEESEHTSTPLKKDIYLILSVGLISLVLGIYTHRQLSNKGLYEQLKNKFIK